MGNSSLDFTYNYLAELVKGDGRLARKTGGGRGRRGENTTKGRERGEGSESESKRGGEYMKLAPCFLLLSKRFAFSRVQRLHHSCRFCSSDLGSVSLQTARTAPCYFDDHPCRQLVENETKFVDRVSPFTRTSYGRMTWRSGMPFFPRPWLWCGHDCGAPIMCSIAHGLAFKSYSCAPLAASLMR